MEWVFRCIYQQLDAYINFYMSDPWLPSPAEVGLIVLEESYAEIDTFIVQDRTSTLSAWPRSMESTQQGLLYHAGDSG